MHAPQTEADQLSGPSIHVHPVVTGRGAKRFPLIRPPHTHTPAPRPPGHRDNQSVLKQKAKRDRRVYDVLFRLLRISEIIKTLFKPTPKQIAPQYESPMLHVEQSWYFPTLHPPQPGHQTKCRMCGKHRKRGHDPSRRQAARNQKSVFSTL